MHAIIIGATGATGRELVAQALADPAYRRVILFVRHAPNIQHDKLGIHEIDFRQPENWQHSIQGDVLFAALGTTRKDAGSQSAQYAIDYTAQYQFAAAARANGVPTLVLVSAAGANANSPFFYPRIKGELEHAVRQLGFERVLLFRPPLLDRGNNARGSEKIAAAVICFANRFGCLKNQRPLPVAQLARAMLAAVANQAVCGTQIYEAADIWKLVE